MEYVYPVALLRLLIKQVTHLNTSMDQLSWNAGETFVHFLVQKVRFIGVSDVIQFHLILLPFNTQSKVSQDILVSTVCDILKVYVSPHGLDYFGMTLLHGYITHHMYKCV